MSRTISCVITSERKMAIPWKNRRVPYEKVSLPLATCWGKRPFNNATQERTLCIRWVWSFLNWVLRRWG